MLCVTCGQPSRFNRAVQHSEAGLVGTLCATCERRVFDRPLGETPAWRETGCHLCGRPAVVALPEHRLLVDGRDDLEAGGYFLSPETPLLCERHAPPGVDDPDRDPPGDHLSVLEVE
jgi:hypothetical protein